MGIEASTVHTLRSKIFLKLGVRTITQAVMIVVTRYLESKERLQSTK